MKKSIFLYSMALALTAFLFAACSDDDNPVAVNEFGEISGTVNFVGNWPAVGEVQVSAWIAWPPAGPPAAASEALTATNGSAPFKLEGLQKGTYQMITVGWRDPTNPMGAKVLGVYWAQSDSLGVDSSGNVMVQPIPMVVDDNQMVHSNIVIKANLDVVK